MADGDEDMPRDANIIKTLLKSMGVDEYEPRVVRQFLELWYRYVVDILTDSQVYSEHAGKSVIDVDDVKIATQAKVNFSFSQPPPREVLMELSNIINKKPLDRPISGLGIALPPEQDTLISPNYQLAFPKKQAEPTIEEFEDDEEEVAANPVSNPPLPQEQHKATELPQNAQRVSFQIGAKRPRSEFD